MTGDLVEWALGHCSVITESETPDTNKVCWCNLGSLGFECQPLERVVGAYVQYQKRVWIRYVIPINALVMQQEYGITTVFFL
ncbi:hypothetical protein P167DRAFT_329287 [Morchella conica CCBAS932]|uniref:Uncharacterized protein n=1 Tax=Morchella conica CCBAS932 TaxID=1392247 RepID=A0A3N4KHV9_9PEZI|nr:hypothetical protein P167DRAFT_329287 [Morchella conica CCBAS932]